MPTNATTQQETAKAAEAFADYANMEPGKRSLRALAEIYARQNRYKTSTTAFNQISTWSTKFQWQARIAEAVTEAVTRKLEQSAELDADTFLKTSQRLNQLVSSPGHIDPGTITRVRESVRKPEPKTGASVSVNVSVEVRHMAEKMAKELGLDAEQLIRDAEEIAEAAWNKGTAS